MKQSKPFPSALSLAKAFLTVTILSLCAFSANAQPTRVGITGFSEITNFYTEKVYDGTNVLPIAPSATITLTGVADGDTVTATAYGTYASAEANTGITYTITFTLSGPQAASYTIDTTVTGTNGRITPRPLTVSGTVLDSSKVYDGTTTCTVANRGTISGGIAGDLFIFSATASYLDPNAGENKPVAVTYAITGNTNYTAPSDDTLYADITPKPIHIGNVDIARTKLYDGSTTAAVLNHGIPVSSELIGLDDVIPVHATANFSDKNVGIAKSVVVTFELRGPQGPNYIPIDDTSLTADILPRIIVMEGAEVRLCKEYDGTDAATVLQNAHPTNIVDGDSVVILTSAVYDTPDTGHNKSIYLNYTFADNSIDQLNYNLPVREGYSVRGKIILPTQLAVLDSESGEFSLTTEGMCEGDIAAANYQVTQGEPVRYSLAFSAEALATGFADVTDAPLPGIGDGTFISIPVPSTCAFGHYYVDITFTNEAEVSVQYRFPFTVNYSTNYLDALFTDVICVNNTENIFTTYQWYRDGQAIEGATKQYYYQEGGLNGTYYVRVNAGTETEGRTCEQSFNNATAKNVSIAPNPVSSTANVILEGFAEGEHTLQLFNAYGQQMLSVTFSGNEYILDLSAMPQGSYIINVDGERAKALKF